MSALRPMPMPVDVQVLPDGVIQVVWQDGHRSVYRSRRLRANCPCAVCVDEWTHEVRVNIDDIPENLTPHHWSRVGNYALTFTWSDGHSTGIYAYDFLRAQCACDDCAEQTES